MSIDGDNKAKQLASQVMPLCVQIGHGLMRYTGLEDGRLTWRCRCGAKFVGWYNFFDMTPAEVDRLPPRALPLLHWYRKNDVVSYCGVSGSAWVTASTWDEVTCAGCVIRAREAQPEAYLLIPRAFPNGLRPVEVIPSPVQLPPVPSRPFAFSAAVDKAIEARSTVADDSLAWDDIWDDHS